MSETDLVCEDAVLASAPEVGEPVESGQLEVLELSSGRLDVARVLGDLGELGPPVGVVVGPPRDRIAPLPRHERLDLDRARRVWQVLCALPRVLRVGQVVPLAKVLDPVRVVRLVGCAVALGEDALDDLERLLDLGDPLALDRKRLEVLSRGDSVVEDVVLALPDEFDVVVDPLEALEPALLQEGVRLLGVVQVRVVLPLDVEALKEQNRGEERE